MKPILFNTEMVRAILDNRKTVTRRVVKPLDRIPENAAFGYTAFTLVKMAEEIFFKLPYHPDGILYVRETWQKNPYGIGWPYFYKASPEEFDHAPDKWRPSIHMPREAARIFLRVTDVRVERLQDITEEQAEAEGCGKWYVGTKLESPARSEFCKVWDSTIKKADRALYGWEANPWVWVIGFERIRKEDAR